MPIADVLEIIAHLSTAASLRLDGVAWDDYAQLLHRLRESSAVRGRDWRTLWQG